MVARKRKETGRKSKYTEDMPVRFYMLVVECGMASRHGEILWGKVGKFLDVAPSTMHNWRNPSKPETYHEEFHKAAKRAKEAVDAGAIKRGLIDLGKPHITNDRTFELRKIGPKPPPQNWLKQYLIDWADEELDLHFEPGMTKPEVYQAILFECGLQTKEEMVETKRREQEVVDVGAAKLAVANIGPQEERWTDKHEVKTPDEKLTDEDREAIRAVLRANQE
ncbi:MAG: hypothetical protein V3W44_04380 [Dehalococcoidales bacterium]